MKKWQTLTSEKVYENNWIKVTHENVIAPTGNKGIYGKVHFKNYAIGIVPIDDNGNTWLVGQQRYPLDEYSWEIIEGGGFIEDNILDAAKRELKEEVGLIAKDWKELCTFNTSNSVTDEVAIIFIAKNFEYTTTAPDATELLEIKKIALVDAIEMAINGTIKDSLSLVALFKIKILMDKNQL